MLSRESETGIIGPSQEDIEECNRLTGPIKESRFRRWAKVTAEVLGLSSVAAIASGCDVTNIVRPAPTPIPECGELPKLCYRIERDINDQTLPIIYWKSQDGAVYRVYERESLIEKPDQKLITERKEIVLDISPEVIQQLKNQGAKPIEYTRVIPDSAISEFEIISSPGIRPKITPSSYVGAAEGKVPWTLYLDYKTTHLITLESCVNGSCIQSEEITVRWNPGEPVLSTPSEYK